MPIQSADRRRCGTCLRWRGERQAVAAENGVEIASETSVGLCDGGPWDGSERRARSACGHWCLWPMLADPSIPESPGE